MLQTRCDRVLADQDGWSGNYSAVYDGGATFPSGGLLPSVHGRGDGDAERGVAPGKIGVGVIF